jgi:hypothetical protein
MNDADFWKHAGFFFTETTGWKLISVSLLTAETTPGWFGPNHTVRVLPILRPPTGPMGSEASASDS